MYEFVIGVVEGDALFLDLSFDWNCQSAADLIERADHRRGDGKERHENNGPAEPVIEFLGSAVVFADGADERKEQHQTAEDHREEFELLK